jgi:hypothetical protein
VARVTGRTSGGMACSSVYFGFAATTCMASRFARGRNTSNASVDGAVSPVGLGLGLGFGCERGLTLKDNNLGHGYAGTIKKIERLFGLGQNV